MLLRQALSLVPGPDTCKWTKGSAATMALLDDGRWVGDLLKDSLLNQPVKVVGRGTFATVIKVDVRGAVMVRHWA